MAARDRFRDGAGLLATYEWDIGHETEDPREQTTQVERTALTSGVGYVRQQGAPSPNLVKLAGWAVDPAQITAMASYFNACAGIGTASRTIFWRDIDGEEYEVLITSWAPVRQLGRSRGLNLNYVWKWTITMEVIRKV